MRYVLSIICGLMFCAIPLTAEAGLFGRRCNHCYGHHYVPQNILIEQETIIIPRRVTRYNEIPGLQLNSLKRKKKLKMDVSKEFVELK